MRYRSTVLIAVAVIAAAALAHSQTEQRAEPKASRAKPNATHAATLAAPVTLDDALEHLRLSSAYGRAQAELARGNHGRIELTLVLTPGKTAGTPCICSGGKGELDGKPTNWPCDCSPPGCGTCGSLTTGK